MTDPREFVGIATPQANPTVELEMNRCFRDPVHALVTRLTSGAQESTQRLVDYFHQMPEAVASFDTLPLRAFAFACTGSAYLVGAEDELEMVERLQSRFGFPVITATRAIRNELQLRGARRIAVLSPYPPELREAAISYWNAAGLQIVATRDIDIGTDTRAIYALTRSDVDGALASFDTDDADVIVLSGTGMPSLDAMLARGTDIISSNLCLATEVLRQIGHWPADAPADIRQLLKHTKHRHARNL